MSLRNKSTSAERSLSRKETIMSMRLIILALVFGISFTATAQRDIYDDANWSLKERAYMGFGLGGLSFGRDAFGRRFFSIGASAQTGYMITKNLSSGIGFEYQYSSYSDLGWKDHLYGGYPFIRYNIKNFFIQTDYGFYTFRVDRDYKASISEERFFVGLGHTSGSGGRARFNILVSYDMLYTNSSIFASPLSIRAYMTFH